jgi:transcriptional regulator of acetoin/glycerol metabolism
MVETNLISHIEEVERVAAGSNSTRDTLVLESWKRCVDTHGLDPARMQEAYIVPDYELREHRERTEKLIRTARFALESLHRQVAGLGYVLLLSDAEGITVDFIGDPTFNNNLRKAGLYLGSNWKEEFAGTCAVGSCLATQEALIVHQTDHFDATHIPLTCTAAPIHDINGRFAAVLDISALCSPQAKESQFLALQLVNSYIRRIEMANLLSSFSSEWIVQLSPSHEFLGVDPGCAVALDASARIVGFTNDAQRLLAQQVDVDWREFGQLLGRRFDEFFDFDPDRLSELSRARPVEERLIETRNGPRLFAHAIAPQQSPPKSASSKSLPRPLRELAGRDSAMKEMLRKAAHIADSQISLLLLGDTGTGKEKLARAIHASRHTAGTFVAVNCAALPESLIESELFGYLPGAFTGALKQGKKGLIQQADCGTLFLDEIGDMPLALQARLLRVLSEREVLPIGGDRPIPVDIRVVAATHEDLAALIQAGQFREDLYYRLNGAVLTLPPLHQRQDFDWLLDKLMAKRTAQGSKTLRFDSKARDRLRHYRWPGNIRELINAIDFACTMCETDVIGLEDLPELFNEPSSSFNLIPGATPELSEEATNLNNVLAAHRWNITAAARFLCVDRTTVHRKMKRLGIVPPNRRTN